MHVVFHSDAFAKSTPYGLGRYAEELWKELSLDTSLELQPFSIYGKGRRAGVIDPTSELSITKPNIDHRVLMACWSLFGGPGIKNFLKSADLIHTVELDYPIPPVDIPWVATVHDIGPLSHPEFFSKSRPYLRKRGLQQAASEAATIIAVSNATAESVQEYLGRDLGDRLQVIYEGVDQYFFEPADQICLNCLKDMPPKEKPFFLWTGSLNPRKNIVNVLKAFREVATDTSHHLVLAGGIGWDAERLIQDINLKEFSNRIHRPGYVTNEQLRALYQMADAFVYASLMEGFGLPILEAMASGCPVITSNVSAMPEVAGNAALLVDPNDYVDIAAAMRRLISSESLREELSKAGERRAIKFTWNACATQVVDVYKKVCCFK